jgi:hypothetical protein
MKGRGRILSLRFAGRGEGALVAGIDPAMDELAVEGVGVVLEGGLGPFKEGEPGAVGEFVEHAGGHEFG